MKLQPLQVRSNARPAFERTTVERRSHIRTYSSSAREVRVALAGPIVHRFKLAPWAVIYVQTQHLHSNARDTAMQLRPNARQEERTHARVHSNAHPAFERTPDLAAHFILSINMFSLFSLFPTFGNTWRRSLWPKSSPFITVKPSKRHFIIYFILCF
jgi:hypothetical protein